MNNVITKINDFYGNVRFVKDYNGIYKPIAKDIISITGNNTTVNYHDDSLLERRELYSLVESSDENLMLFSDWIYSNFDILNNTNNKTILFKNEAEILNTISIDDFACIDIHPFSCNKMYEAHRNRIERTEAYNAWWNNFPAENLAKFKDVDFNEPVFVWYHFKCLPSYDIENLLKPTSDKICDFLATDDSNFKHFRIDGDYIDKYNEGKIYIFIANIEEQKGPFD